MVVGDEAWMDSVGLTTSVENPGMVTEHFEEIVRQISSVQVDTAIIDRLYSWSYNEDDVSKSACLVKHAEALFEAVHACTIANNKTKTVSGWDKLIQHIAEALLTIMSTVSYSQPSQKIAAVFSPLAFATLERILDSNVKISAPPKKDTSEDGMRCTICTTLLQFIPYTGSVHLSNGFAIVARVLMGSYPKDMKSQAKSSASTLSTVDKESLKHCGVEFMNILKMGGNDDMVYLYGTVPELYANAPEAVHYNIDFLLTQQWVHVSYLIYTVATKCPACLVPHVEYFIARLREDASMGGMPLQILNGIAHHDPNVVYPHIDTIISLAKSVPSANITLAPVIGAVGKATCDASAADDMLAKLIAMLNTNTDNYARPVIFNEILNLTEKLSSPDVIKPYMNDISKHRTTDSIMVTKIEDFAAGRSLEGLATRVDEIDAHIMQLNDKVAQNCSNFEDVVAYVDAHISELKDFIGEVVKKLPTPKRLEVKNKVYKTFILYFEDCRNGYELPITSQDWNKWLKMGFSLAKAGKAVIDIGTGNPLGLISTGISVVRGIYEAYKSQDDDEFNDYITNPFLTSSEQDLLLEKLRDQGFFEKMAYDAQMGGWYLLHPDRDGQPPAGDVGSVTHTTGGSIVDAATAAAKSALKEIAPNVAAAVRDAKAVTEGVREDLQGSNAEDEKEKQPSSASSNGKVKVNTRKVVPLTQDDANSLYTEHDEQIRALRADVTSLQHEIRMLKQQKQAGCIIM